jgi:hypothetical protein
MKAGGVNVIIDGALTLRYNHLNCNTRRFIVMPVSLRIPQEKVDLIRKAAAKAGMSNTAYILDAIDEKLGIVKDREQTIRDIAGWLSHEEAEELRQVTGVFGGIHEGDWA